MKQLIIKSVLLAAALIMPGKSLAYDFMVDGIAYNILSESTCEVTSYIVTNQNRYGGDITIPEQVTYDGVTRTVTQIGDDAFNECINLTSVDIPNSVTTIGDYAFAYSSKKLKNVNIGNSVTTIGYAAFYGCTSLTGIDIPNSVTTIGCAAFEGCTSLASVNISSSVTTIESRTFEGCTSLTSVEIPNSVTTIGDYAFQDCKGLTSVEFPNSVTTIGDYAFEGCTGLMSVEIPNSVTTIGSSAFHGCTSLASIELPNSVTTIESDAFYGCTSLASIEIPNSVTTIGSSAFHGCTSLVSIDFPNTVTTIEKSTFNGCTSLMGFDFPNSVAVIGDYAFQDCKGFTSIVIPNSVTTIGEEAFSGCSNIRELVFEDNEEELILDWKAFSGCFFAKLYVGRNLTCKQTVYGYLMNFIYLTDVTMGNLVTDVTAILWDMNKNLASIKLLTTMPPATREFADTQYKNVKVTVPAGSLDNYEKDTVWRNFFKIQEDTSTGISNVETPDGQGVKVENGNIVVENAKGRVSVYDVAGTLINSIKAEGNRVEIAVPGSGVYIVRAGGKAVKVAM